VVSVLDDDWFRSQGHDLLSSLLIGVVNDPAVQSATLRSMIKLVQDEALQEQTGSALWNAVTTPLIPSTWFAKKLKDLPRPSTQSNSKKPASQAEAKKQTDNLDASVANRAAASSAAEDKAVRLEPAPASPTGSAKSESTTPVSPPEKAPSIEPKGDSKELASESDPSHPTDKVEPSEHEAKESNEAPAPIPTGDQKSNEIAQKEDIPDTEVSHG